MAGGPDRRRITHLNLYAPDGLDIGEVSALAALRWLSTGRMAQKVRVQLVTLGRPVDLANVSNAIGLSSTWISSTPFVCPGKIVRSGLARYFRKTIRWAWRRWRPNLEHITLDLVEALSEDEPLWQGRPRPFEFCRLRSTAAASDFRRPFGLFRLVFSEPVAGPLCLGYGAHFGLGQFVADL